MMLEQELDAHAAVNTPARGYQSAAWKLAFLLVALIAGFVAGWLAFDRAPAEESPEAIFSRDMAAHHDQAVEMATIIRDRSSDEQLRTFALDIMLTQQAQLGMMEGWLGVWGLPLVKGPPMGGQAEMMGMATQAQVNELKSLPIDEAEEQFLRLMIRHHQGGVAMAQEALDEADHPEVLRLAETIVEGQQGEIDYMQDLLQQRGVEAEPLQPMPEDHGTH